MTQGHGGLWKDLIIARSMVECYKPLTSLFYVWGVDSAVGEIRCTLNSFKGFFVAFEFSFGRVSVLKLSLSFVV